MQNDLKKDPAGALGITFSEVHSDEPHEAVNAKAVEVTSKHTEQKSHLSNHGGVFNVGKAFDEDHQEEGTIVSEKRRRKTSFVGSLGEAFNEWFGKTKENLSLLQEKLAAEKKAEPVTVAKAETRKDVIEKAATHANLPPKDDSKIVIEKIRTYNRDVAHVTGQTIIKPAVQKQSAWGSTQVPPHETAPVAKKTPAPQATRPAEHDVVAPLVAQRVMTKIHDVPAPAKIEASATAPIIVTPIASSHVAHVAPKVRPVSSHIAPVVTNQIKKEIEQFSNPKIVDTIEYSHTRFATQEPETPQKSEVSWTHVLSIPSLETEEETKQPKSNDVPVNLPILEVPEPKKVESPAVPQKIEVAVPAPIRVTPSVPEPSNFVSQTYTADLSVQEPAPEQISLPPIENVAVLPPPPAEKIAVTAPQPVTSPYIQPEFRSAPVPSNVKRELGNLENRVSQNAIPQGYAGTPSNMLRYIIRGGILLTTAVLGVVLAFVVKSNIPAQTNDEPIVTEMITPVSSLTGTGDISTIKLEGSPAQFRTLLDSEIRSGPAGLTEIQPQVIVNGVSQNATAQELLTYLAANLSAGVQRSMGSTMTIGSITTSRNEPFVILRSTNFDTLFAGMLSWETRIQSDFNPIFGTPLSTPTSFRDAIRGNASTRILYDASGKEVLLYSFINQKTVVITTSSEALSALVSKF